jgi:hypothetical protein
MEGKFMSQNPPEQAEPTYSQEEVQLAESQEQNELVSAQNAHLRRRVVVLRVEKNRIQAELEVAQAKLRELEPEVDTEEELEGSDEEEVPAP